MHARISHFVIDCPDPSALAGFYSELLEAPIVRKDEDWVDVDIGSCKLSFQQAPNLQAPDWPNPDRPQQMHLDIEIDSRAVLDEAQKKATSLGAKQLTGDQDGFRVYKDPAGHPFCFVWHE